MTLGLSHDHEGGSSHHIAILRRRLEGGSHRIVTRRPSDGHM